MSKHDIAGFGGEPFSNASHTKTQKTKVSSFSRGYPSIRDLLGVCALSSGFVIRFALST